MTESMARRARARLAHLTFGVSVHARERARERFPDFKAARIVDEVRVALLEGRVSPRKPDGIHPPDDPGTLYVWTEDGARVYAIRVDRHDPDRFVVTTTMAADLPACS